MKADVESTTCVFAARPCGMEARDQWRSRTQVNPRQGWSGLGKRAFQRDSRFPTVAGTVVRAAIVGSDSTLPQEISTDPHTGGNVHEGNDVRVKSVEKSDHLIVALKPGNAGRAKEVTS